MGRKSTKENKNIYQISREEMNYSREAAAEKVQSKKTKGTIVKVVIGVICIISAFMTGSLGAALTGIVIGLALIAWGLLPWLLPRLRAKKEAAAAKAEAAAKEEARLNEPKRCAACGAVTKGDTCEYCGAPLK